MTTRAPTRAIARLDEHQNGRAVERQHPVSAVMESSINLPIAGVHITATGITMPEDLTLDEWKMIGLTLHHVENIIGWVIGEWERFGERKYGELRFAVLEMGLNYQTVANAGYVASRIEPSRRRENVPYTHHAALAPLEIPEQERLLDKVVAENLSVRELREEVRLVKITKRKPDVPPPPSTRDLTIGEQAALDERIDWWQPRNKADFSMGWAAALEWKGEE